MSVRAALLELFYPAPVRCLCCREEEPGKDGLICPACAARLEADPPHAISLGGGVSRAVAAHPYAGTAGALVRALKYRGVPALARAMGNEMCTAMRLAEMPLPDCVAFVPMHALRRREKYFNQSELIANAVAANLGMRAEVLLKRVRMCRQQARMKSREARAKNVRGAFRATKNLEGMRVLLVDDVCTTGATARECAKALFEAGAKEVFFVAYALD